MAIEAQPLPGGLSWSEEGYFVYQGESKYQTHSFSLVLQDHEIYSDLIATSPTYSIAI